MSIPPLVCSTPPPPEQCEDDKDHDDFDLQYQLPQDDDDDENYDYTSFSSYKFPETNSKKVETYSSIQEESIHSSEPTEHYNKVSDHIESQHCHESAHECNSTEAAVIEKKTKSDEEINIEDLNLIIDKESICSNIDSDLKESPTDGDEISVNNLNIPRVKSKDNLNDVNGLIPSSSNIEPVYSDHTVELDVYATAVNILKEEKPTVLLNSSIELDQDVEPVGTTLMDDTIAKLPDQLDNVLSDDFGDFVDVLEEPKILTCTPNIDIEQESKKPIEQAEFIPDISNKMAEEPPKIVSNESDEDFDDFDDFKSTNPVRKCSTVVDEFHDPWCVNEPVESDFGNFTANFDQSETQPPNREPVDIIQLPINDQLSDDINQEGSDGDDFGDFDDFKSSSGGTAENTTSEDTTYQDVPMLDLPSSDNEPLVLDSINKVLKSMFDEEITEPEGEFEGKLESLLSETWGHLMDIDVRQPYIVNWNNSLGQKTLLKSLCIDSRNILFGPKWSYNMPKYAANLSSAPLQPQRQTSSDSTQNSENMNVEKSANKTGTWEDPFTSEGQDSCNTNQTPTTEPSPADLHVFEETLSSKPNKIYSNTLNIQPIRQISLPDTHIFTPTDSETPRSKTIHYDSGPPVLLPQPVIEGNKNEMESSAAEPCNIPANTNDNDYWEFQDFKGSTSVNIPNQLSQQALSQGASSDTNHALPKTAVGYQTQLLQPIKVDPIMPKLNWPDPGEVKGTFDDFSDFVSNSSWNSEKPISGSPVTTAHPDTYTDLIVDNNQTADSERTKDIGVVQISNADNAFDDEFDTFKCALPVNDNNRTSVPVQSTLPQTPTKIVADFECAFSTMNMKSDISFVNETKTSEALTPNTGHISNTTEVIVKPQPTLSSGLHMLQPTSAGTAMSAQHQQKTAQILQPLSLESYSQINWPSPGIDLQDLSRFNPVETLQSLKTDLSAGNQSKHSSPIHNHRTVVTNQVSDDDVWGEFVSSKPKQPQAVPKKSPVFADDDEWTDFVSSPSVMPQNGLNTISLNVHTSSNLKSAQQNKFNVKNNKVPLDIPTLNYITPKSSNHKAYNDRHFQNL